MIFWTSSLSQWELSILGKRAEISKRNKISKERNSKVLKKSCENLWHRTHKTNSLKITSPNRLILFSVVTETALQFSKTSLGLVNAQKKFKKKKILCHRTTNIQLKVIKIRISLKISKTQSRSQKNMSDSLKTYFSFIGHHSTVNEVCD